MSSKALFHYDKKVVGNVDVVEFNITHKDGIEIIKSLSSTQSSREVWGLTTQKFHKVSMVMNSPNYWDGHVNGNKHLFFKTGVIHAWQTLLA